VQHDGIRELAANSACLSRRNSTPEDGGLQRRNRVILI
jgi:hypothetical protein